MDIIYFYYYDPLNSIFGKRSEHANYHLFYCDCKNSCKAYENKMCLLKNRINCPYGKIKTVEGPTPRAKNYYKFLYDAKEQFKEYSKDSIGFIDRINKITYIGKDYIYLPLSFLDNYVNPIVSKLGIINQVLIPKENFTIENILCLIDFKPLALFGGEIKSYQKEEIPKFVRQLRIFNKDIYKEIIKQRPDVLKYLNDIKYEGKQAYLSSLLPGIVILPDNKKAKWDGEKLIIKTKDLLNNINLNEEEIIITPEKDAIVYIADLNTVDSDLIELVEDPQKN